MHMVHFTMIHRYVNLIELKTPTIALYTYVQEYIDNYLNIVLDYFSSRV